MTDDQTYIVKHHDLGEMLSSGGNPHELEEFLEQPFAAIAESIIGFYERGSSGALAIAIGGRLVQAAFKGHLFQQAAAEIKRLRQAGRLPHDFNKHPNGYQTWVDLFTIIDNEVPDEERLEALKAMFFAVNRINANEGERIIAYQLFQISKKLTSGELLLLKANYECYKASIFQTNPSEQNLSYWIDPVCKKLGHNLIALVELHEQALVDNRLLSSRSRSGGVIMQGQQGRLTDLGCMFCQNIQTYQAAKHESEQSLK